MSTQRKLFSQDLKESSHPQEISKKKKPKIKRATATTETLNKDRAKYLAEDGSKCAIKAKKRGLGANGYRGYIYLIGDNNQKAWLIGWQNEFNK